MTQIIPPRGDNEALSEHYRLKGEEWVDADAAARLLEELKTTVLEQRKNALVETSPGMPDAHAERKVKADPEWEEWIRGMVGARTKANRLKVYLKSVEMRHGEMQSAEATRRAEMKL